MYLPVPADWVIQPLFLRETQRRFDLRTDVGFTEGTVKVGDEDHRRNLIHQDAVHLLATGGPLFLVICLCPRLVGHT
jgi:hypothetical protein